MDSVKVFIAVLVLVLGVAVGMFAYFLIDTLRDMSLLSQL